MSIWAIADTHLSFGVPSKSMELFGPVWKDYAEKMARNWKERVAPNDLVLIAGDISWATAIEDALVDLRWIDALPGTKVIIRGNHDYWWPSSAKLAKILPPSIQFVHNTAFNWNDVTIGGSRLWDSEEYRFNDCIEYQPREGQKQKDWEKEREEAKKIFPRELERLKLSLKQLSPSARYRIAMTHYPPISADLKPSLASAILEEFKIDVCVFGHLHNVKKGVPLFGEARGVRYLLTSCDYLDFIPLKIL